MVPSVLFPVDQLGADIAKPLTFNREPHAEDDRANDGGAYLQESG